MHRMAPDGERTSASMGLQGEGRDRSVDVGLRFLSIDPALNLGLARAGLRLTLTDHLALLDTRRDGLVEALAEPLRADAVVGSSARQEIQLHQGRSGQCEVVTVFSAIDSALWTNRAGIDCGSAGFAPGGPYLAPRTGTIPIAAPALAPMSCDLSGRSSMFALGAPASAPAVPGNPPPASTNVRAASRFASHPSLLCGARPDIYIGGRYNMSAACWNSHAAPDFSPSASDFLAAGSDFFTAGPDSVIAGPDFSSREWPSSYREEPSTRCQSVSHE